MVCHPLVLLIKMHNMRADNESAWHLCSFQCDRSMCKFDDDVYKLSVRSGADVNPWAEDQLKSSKALYHSTLLPANFMSAPHVGKGGLDIAYIC